MKKGKKTKTVYPSTKLKINPQANKNLQNYYWKNNSAIQNHKHDFRMRNNFNINKRL